MKIKLKEIMKYRYQIMGVATLLVMIVHLYGSDTIPEWLKNIQRFAQNGVELFLLISGIGVYYSLKKNSVKVFYSNRLKRIMPAFLVVFAVMGFIKVGSWGYAVGEYFRESSLGSFFRGYTVGWYTVAILILYAISPLLVYLLDRFNTVYWCLFALCTICIARMNFLEMSSNLYLVHELFLNRIPIYMLALAAGKLIYEQPEKEYDLGRPLMIVAVCGLTVLYFVNSFVNKANMMSMCHYIAAAATPIYVLYLAAFFREFECRELCKIGEISYESYLLNEKIGLLAYVYITGIKNFEINLIAFLGTILLGLLLRRVVTMCVGGQKV